MSTPGVGGGGTGTGITSSGAGVGGGVATAVALPQTGILPQTGSRTSLLLLVVISLAVAVIASMISAQVSKRLV